MKRSKRRRTRWVNPRHKRHSVQLDPDLPTTIEAVEHRQYELICSCTKPFEYAGEVKIGPLVLARLVSPSSEYLEFCKLHEQLFKLVFGREPGNGDPYLWDRTRERDGCFTPEPEAYVEDLIERIVSSGLGAGAPSIVWAMRQTLMNPMLIPTSVLGENTSEVEQYVKCWEDALAEYADLQ